MFCNIFIFTLLGNTSGVFIHSLNMHLIFLIYWHGEMRRIVLFFHIALFVILLPSLHGKGHQPVQVAEMRDVYKTRQVNWMGHQHDVCPQRLMHLISDKVPLTPAVTGQLIVCLLLFWAVWLTQVIGEENVLGNVSSLVGKWNTERQSISGLFVFLGQISAGWMIYKGWCESLFIKVDFLWKR